MATKDDHVRELLTMDLSSQVLSNALFGPTGLFNQIAHTEEQRRAFSKTALFQYVSSRITDLRRGEVAEARRKIQRRSRKKRNGPLTTAKKSLASRSKTLALPARRSGSSNPQKKQRKSG
jgi:hypothetical protein